MSLRKSASGSHIPLSSRRSTRLPSMTGLSVGLPTSAPCRQRSSSVDRCSLASTRSGSSGLPQRGGEIARDPRPLKDKGYKEDNIRQLLEFFTQHADFQYSLTAKQLAMPSRTDVLVMFKFLYEMIEPGCSVELRTMDEVMPQKFAQLRYPFRISKSMMQGVATPHGWPTMLAALVWLKNLCQLCMEVDTNLIFAELPGAQASFDSDRNMTRSQANFEFYEQAYLKKVDGSEGLQEDLEEELMILRRRRGLDGEEDMRIEAETQKMRRKVEEARAVQAQLADREQKALNTQRDFAKLEEYNKALEGQLAAVRQESAEKREEGALLREKLQKCLDENEEKRARIASQPLSVGEVRRIRAERATLQQQLRQAENEKERIAEEAASAEIQFSRQQAKMEEAVSVYNKKASEVARLASCDPAQLEMRCDYLSVNDNQSGFREAIQPRLQKLKTDAMNEIHRQEEHTIELHRKADQIDNNRQEMLAMIEDNKKQKEASEALMETERVEFAAKKQSLDEQKAAWLAKIDQLSKLSAADEESLRQKLQQQRTQHAEELARAAAEAQKEEDDAWVEARNIQHHHQQWLNTLVELTDAYKAWGDNHRAKGAPDDDAC